MFQLLGEIFEFFLSLFGSSKVHDKNDIARIEQQVKDREARKAERNKR